MMTDYCGVFLVWMLTVTLFIFMLRAISGQFHAKAKLPPSPPSLPIIGHAHLLGPIPHQAFHNLSKHYGPLLLLSFGSKSFVLVSSPEMARECLRANEASFLNRPSKINLDYVTYGRSDLVTAPYGPYWKFMRKLCMSKLLGATMLLHHSPARAQELKLFIHNILEKADSGEEVDVGEEVALLACNIITRMAFRGRCYNVEGEGRQLVELVKEMAELSGKFNLGDMGWFFKMLDLQGFKKRLESARNRYDFLVKRIVREHEEARRRMKKEISKESDEAERDLLDILLDIYEDESSEIKLTVENIKAFIMNMVGAGTDTSSLTVTWAMAELMKHPEMMEKAREEIDTVVGKGRLVEESDIPNLPYVESIAKETLRLHPTGPLVARQSTQECEIDGYVIPAKTSLFINVWAIGRDPNYWENPLEFKPERFMNEEGRSEMNLIKGWNFELLSFGAGSRACPGASLAMKFVPTTLAALIQCFEWKLAHEGEVDMEEGPGLALPLAHPLLCILVPRTLPFLSPS